MSMETLDLEKKEENIIEFKTGAEKLYNQLIQLSDVIELGDDVKSIQARTRAETAAILLQKLPNKIDESMIEFREKALYECRQGIVAFEPKNNFDKSTKKNAINIIEQLEAFEK